MRLGDFSALSTPLFNPYSTRTAGGVLTRDRFQCDSAGNALGVNADGTQPAGTPCNVIPQALINPISAQMVNFYPLPNVVGNSAGNYVNSPVRSLNEGEFDVRLDHNFST